MFSGQCVYELHIYLFLKFNDGPKIALHHCPHCAKSHKEKMPHFNNVITFHTCYHGYSLGHIVVKFSDCDKSTEKKRLFTSVQVYSPRLKSLH